MKRFRNEYDMASRKWKRMFSQAVISSIFKTITEPVTNSWDSYKKLGILEDSIGFVEKFMNLKAGDRVDHAELLNGVSTRRQRCKIAIRVCTTKKGDLKKDQCQIIDQAAGLTIEGLEEIMSEYGADKTSGTPVRGLFGQGLADVLWGHSEGRLVSFKDGQVSTVTVGWNERSKPAWSADGLGNATVAKRKVGWSQIG